MNFSGCSKSFLGFHPKVGPSSARANCSLYDHECCATTVLLIQACKIYYYYTRTALMKFIGNVPQL